MTNPIRFISGCPCWACLCDDEDALIKTPQPSRYVQDDLAYRIDGALEAKIVPSIGEVTALLESWRGFSKP